MKKRGFLIYVLIIFIQCNPTVETTYNMTIPEVKINQTTFGYLADSTTVTLFTLTNNEGMEMKVMDYGCTVTSLIVKDKLGNPTQVTLGFDDLESYIAGTPYFGGVIGRYANRIGKGQFSINERKYSVATNNGPNHLHGGNVGFDKVMWDTKIIETAEGNGLEFSYTSPHMEEGYPGNLSCKVQYLLKNNNEFVINYSATTDQPTLCNMTQHAYFNLGDSDILNYHLDIKAKQFTPVDETLIPTGEFRNVVGTPFEFDGSQTIGSRIENDNEQLQIGLGYDHNYILERKTDHDLELAAVVSAQTTGIMMEVFTKEPGVQFYTGNFLDGTITGRNGVVYKKNYALCLETQTYPDSPNKTNFPSRLLLPGDEYKSQTVYKFSIKQ